jgi:hypothetical protein
MSKPKLWTPGPAEFRGVDPWWHIVHEGPQYIWQTREARKMARHYDGFNVGGLAVAASNEGDFYVPVGANQKLCKGETPSKVCAEIVSAAKVKNVQTLTNKPRIKENQRRPDEDKVSLVAYQIAALFASGPPQPDTHSGLVTPTLHSCGLERELMRKNRLFRLDTLVVTVHPEKDIFEIYENRTLQLMHTMPGSIEPQPHDDPGFERWAAAGPIYDETIAKFHEQGIEPQYALAAKWAITGKMDPEHPLAA